MQNRKKSTFYYDVKTIYGHCLVPERDSKIIQNGIQINGWN